MSDRRPGFTGDREYLSNFFAVHITHDRIPFPTVEHAYQASKTLDERVRYRIAAMPTPGQAKAAGRRVKLRSDWEEVKIDLMYSFLCQKFDPYHERENNRRLAAKLVATGDEELVEWNVWNDNFWGIDIRTPMKGHNWLGKLLMRRRRELQGR